MLCSKLASQRNQTEPTFFFFSLTSLFFIFFILLLEVGRYIAYIDDRYRYRISTLDIGFFDISIRYRLQVKYR